ncbi:hypothetical protein THASP1DRAFT_27144 [Thamnocephalis sphaerospora]|uniref:Uncharacterized protein n=1 Tax=Thamnocephalis sphaerospora TaxID=78915 RepID=A0A4P9XXE2_9FUNG|nr:hypothetical protein THASP1DRAFT_27144 [Thamnocephalis sphaerospora]|eukprot:RKP11045.1 hypothetical protein THASP1DRAFT_27144 [Thamnocephalis sphaerospora]
MASMDPPSLHFRSLHTANASMRGTPIKARAPKTAGTPKLLKQVLMSNQRGTPKVDHHALFDATTPYSDASTEMENDTERFLQMNSPPVTLQFTLPQSKTPGRTAVDALLDDMSPISTSPFGASAQFLTRVHEMSTRSTAGGGTMVSESAGNIPSVVHRHHSVSTFTADGEQASTSTGGHGQPSVQQFVTGLDDIDSLLEMSDMPVAESAKKQLARMTTEQLMGAGGSDGDGDDDDAMHNSRDGGSPCPPERPTGWVLGTPPRTQQPQISSTPMVFGSKARTNLSDGTNMSFGMSVVADASQIGSQRVGRASTFEHREQGGAATMAGDETCALPEFSLDMFPASPPGSLQLQQVYNTFKAHAGQTLDMPTLEQLLPNFGAERIALLADLLVRRRFLRKQQGPGQAWATQWTLRGAP